MSKRIQVSDAPTAPRISRIENQGGASETYTAHMNVTGERAEADPWRLEPTSRAEPQTIAGASNAGPGTLLNEINEAAQSAGRTDEVK